MYVTDRGIDELDHRCGTEEVSLAWLAERLCQFVDAHSEFDLLVDWLATWRRVSTTTRD